jgi:hypothetical protein
MMGFEDTFQRSGGVANGNDRVANAFWELFAKCYSDFVFYIYLLNAHKILR